MNLPIADVCEALIGAALIDKGLDGATQMVTAILGTPEHTQKVWADYCDSYTRPTYQLLESSPAHIRLAEDIEELVKYKFKHPRLLVSAFTHPSLPLSWDRIPSYQRLEFLGKLDTKPTSEFVLTSHRRRNTRSYLCALHFSKISSRRSPMVDRA